MSQVRHFGVCVGIEGLLARTFPEDFEGLFAKAEGRAMSAVETYAFLWIAKVSGKKVLPTGGCRRPCPQQSRGCTGFDYSGGGCPGYEEEQMDRLGNGATQQACVSMSGEDGPLELRSAYPFLHVGRLKAMTKEDAHRLARLAYSAAPAFVHGEIDATFVRDSEFASSPLKDQLIELLATAGPFMGGVAGVRDEITLDYITCRGAAFHNDLAVTWPRALFWALVLDAQDVDLVFPLLDVRVPLEVGMVLLFDPGVPHAVIRRGETEFSEASFATAGPGQDQAFLGGALHLSADQWKAAGSPWEKYDKSLLEGQLHLNAVSICEATGALTAL